MTIGGAGALGDGDLEWGDGGGRETYARLDVEVAVVWVAVGLCVVGDFAGDLAGDAADLFASVFTVDDLAGEACVEACVALEVEAG
jgi:hypothetical protein